MTQSCPHQIYPLWHIPPLPSRPSAQRDDFRSAQVRNRHPAPNSARRSGLHNNAPERSTLLPSGSDVRRPRQAVHRQRPGAGRGQETAENPYRAGVHAVARILRENEEQSGEDPTMLNRVSGLTNLRTGRAIQKVVVVNGSHEILELLESVLDARHYDVVFVAESEHAFTQIKQLSLIHIS